MRKRIQIILVIVLIQALFTCKNKQESSKKEIRIVEKDLLDNHDISKKQYLKENIVGSWKDLSEQALHFTLFADGTAHSDNMETLLYRKWRIENNHIVFIVESIGNHSSSISEEEYDIIEFTGNMMVLKSNNLFLVYRKIN